MALKGTSTDIYKKNGISRSIAHVIKDVNFQLSRISYCIIVYCIIVYKLEFLKSNTTDRFKFMQLGY